MFKTVSQRVRTERLQICNSCDNYVKHVKFCKKCGCYMPAKIMFADVECPIKLWSTAKASNGLINKIDEAILESWNKE